MIATILHHIRMIFSCPFGYEDENGFHLE